MMNNRWIHRLAHFDRQRILPKIRDSAWRDDLFRRLTQDKEPTKTGRTKGIFPIYAYDYEWDIAYRGKVLKISNLEFVDQDSAGNSSSAGDSDTKETKERSNKVEDSGTAGNPDKAGCKLWGYNIRCMLSRIREGKAVSVVDTRSLEKDIGPRIVIGSEKSWSGFKFDIDTDILLGGGYCLYGEGLYEHVAKLYQMAYDCCIGLHIKPLSFYRHEKDEGSSQELEGRLILPSHHIYPYVGREVISSDVQKHRLAALYEKGKQLFGDAFFINFESQGVVREGPVYEHLRRICRDVRK